MLNLNILGLEEYLDLCSVENKLTNWRIALKLLNLVKRSSTRDDNSNKKFNMIKRSGPQLVLIRASHLIHLKLTQDVFKVKNSNIMSPSDFSVTLSSNDKRKSSPSIK